MVRRTRAGIAGKAGRSDGSAIDIENDVDIESAGDSERGDTRRTDSSFGGGTGIGECDRGDTRIDCGGEGGGSEGGEEREARAREASRPSSEGQRA